jgi:hypothetical protein
VSCSRFVSPSCYSLPSALSPIRQSRSFSGQKTPLLSLFDGHSADCGRWRQLTQFPLPGQASRAFLARHGYISLYWTASDRVMTVQGRAIDFSDITGSSYTAHYFFWTAK